MPPGRKRRGERGRFKSAAEAEEQLTDIELAQRAVRAGKLKKKIDSIQKSRQRLRNELGNIKDEDDAYDQYT